MLRRPSGGVKLSSGAPKNKQFSRRFRRFWIGKRTFLAAYEAADEVKVRLKISAKMRLLEQAAARLVKEIKTDVSAPPSQTSMKASRAARTRWDRAVA